MLQRIQRELVSILTAEDPGSALQQHLERKDLTPEERMWFERLLPEGLQVASLGIVKLRFERLTSGEPELGRLFDEQPETFRELYRQYTSEAGWFAYFPNHEAELFRDWQHKRASA